MFQTVPPKLLTLVEQTIDIADANSSTKMPEFLLVIIPSRISLNVCLNMELLVKLFKKHTLLKGPAARFPDGIHIPPLSDNLVFDDTRVADKGVDAIGGHHRYRVTIVDGRSCMFDRLCTTEDCRRCCNGNDYSTFHLANHFSLNVRPMFRRKEFSLIKPSAELFTHWALIFSIERLL